MGYLFTFTFLRQTRHRQDCFVTSGVAGPDSQTDALCVWSASECVRRRSATAGRTPTQNALVQRSIRIATPDKTKLPRLPVDRRRRDAGQAGSYA